MKKVISVLFLMFLTAICSVTVCSAALPAMTEQQRFSIKEKLTAPVQITDNTENISTFSGELTYSVPELILPGKNGHDVVIRRVHNTSQNDEVMSVQWYYSDFTVTYNNISFVYLSEEGYAYNVIFESEQEMLANAPDTLYFNPNATLAVLTDQKGVQHYIYERVLMPDYAANGILLTRDKSIGGNWTNFSKRECYEISCDNNAMYNTLYQGYDWCYDIPYFRDSHDSTDFTGSYTYDQYEKWENGYFRDYDGNIMEVCWGTDKNADDVRVPIYFNAKNDTGLGYKMEFISVTDIENNGLKYNRTISDNKGRIYYINESSQLIACEDKYGNRILYEDGVITDTLGRTITLGADGITYMDPDGYELGRIRYETDSVNNSEVDPYNVLSTDNTYILRVYDENNIMTEYHYTMRNLLFYYDVAGRSPQSMNFWGLDAYIPDNGFLLTEIIFPNGDKKCYEYIETARFAGNTAIQTKYKVSRSYDITNNNEYVNDFTYIYDNPYEGQINQHSSTTTVTRTADLSYYTDQYNDQRYAEKSSRTYSYGKTITYEYRSVIAGRKFVHKETSKERNYTTISQVNYDTNFNLIEESDGNYTATYTYDPTYNVMLTKTYNQDADTVIRLENTLTEDKKDVAISKVYENDILVSQTDYEYPIYENGYGINTDVWKEDTNRNGVKDEGEGVFTENYFHYDSMYFGDDVFSHSSYIFDITDADGINPDCHSCVTGYDIYGNIIGVEDGNYNSLTLYRDPVGRPTIQYNPDNTTQTVSYNDAENSTIYTNENGEQTITYYNLYGQVTAQYSIVENMWVIRVENFYNSIGQLAETISYRTEDGLDTITTKYEYGYGDRVIKISVYDKDDNLVSQQTKSYQFTPTHYVVITQTTGDNSITPATKKEYYDTVGNLVKEELVNGSEILTTTYTYDKVKNVLTVTDPNGNTTTSTYDYANRLLTQTNPQGSTFTNTYDVGGRLVATTDAVGNQSTFRYDKLDRVIEKTVPLNDLETAKHKYYYDMNSNLILEKVLTETENGTESYQETSYTYNTRDFLTDTTAGGLLQTAYEYDPAGRTTKMLVGSQNPQITEYSYNELGQLVSVTDPDGTAETYQNDLLGNVLFKTDRNGIVTATMYNGQNLPVSVTATKDGITDTMTYTYNMLGSPVSVTNETGTISYTYDNFGRLTLETFPQNVTNAYTYDNNGNRLSYLMKIDGIEKINTAYTYNNLNQLTQVNNGDIITTYSYDANGNLLTETTGGNHSTFTYDDANRMIGLVNSYPSADIEGETVTETESYTYYPNGNKKTVTDMTGKLIHYTYDNAGRLTAETVDDAVTSYTYDGYNNRIGKVGNGVQTSYLYDNRNRLTKETVTENGQTEVTSYQYDPNGNLYSRQTLTYGDNTIQEPKASAVLMGYTADTNDMLLEYNNFNQLTTVTKGNEIISYDYYANGMRKSKTVDGYTTTHIWDGQNMAGEETQDGFVSYLRGNHLIARQTENTTQYYHFNGHGDTLSITNENGTTLQNYAYDAFGNLTSNNAEDINPFRYCGEYFDQETGFIYLRARYYSPEIGRFISEDPVRDGLNWYAYCANNPVMFVDPFGLKYHWIRDYGDVTWDASTSTAYLTIADETVAYTVEAGGTTFIQNNRMYVDDQELYNDFTSDRAQAVIYAMDRACYINTDYPFYGANCTNFVSQCLVAGGLETDDTWNIDKGITWNGWDYDPTAAWGTANGLYHYLVDEKGFTVVGYLTSSDSVESISNFVQPGDVIFWNMYKDPNQNIKKGDMNHAAFVTNVTNGEIYYSGNSEPRRNEPLSGKYNNGDIYIVRVEY